MKHGIKKKCPAVLALLLAGVVSMNAEGFVYAGDAKETAVIAEDVQEISAGMADVSGEGAQPEETMAFSAETGQPGPEAERPAEFTQEEAPETEGDAPQAENDPETEGDAPKAEEAPEMEGNVPQAGEAPETEGDVPQAEDVPEIDGEILQIETEPETGGDVSEAEEVPENGGDVPQADTTPEAEGEPSSAEAFTDGEQEEVQSEAEVELSIAEETVTYQPGSRGLWNPAVHRYENSVPGKWSCEDSGLEVVLTNKGAAEVTLTLLYLPASGFEQITGYFTDTHGNTVVEISVLAGASATVYLHLHGEPEENMTDTTIGSVTYKLAEEA